MEKLIRRLPSMNEEVIASASNQTIKTLARLLLKKYRDESDYFLAEGAHMLQEASQAGLLKAIFVYGKTRRPDLPFYRSLKTIRKSP